MRALLGAQIERTGRTLRVHLRQLEGETRGEHAEIELDVLGVRALAALCERAANTIDDDHADCEVMLKGTLR